MGLIIKPFTWLLTCAADALILGYRKFKSALQGRLASFCFNLSTLTGCYECCCLFSL